jgi:microcin C transport system substrate-binding protein
MFVALFAVASGAQGATLPKNIKWETNTADPVWTSSDAKIAGTNYDYMMSYPLTFRLYGPNSNDAFAGYTREQCWFSLVSRHPNTFKAIPQLATHWAVMKDQKTLYFKLDKDAKWSDGKKITADDYVFAYEMMLSKHIKDPYYNKYYTEQFESVEKIDDHTLKIVGKYPSWRALFMYDIPPVARHATKLNADWVKKSNWKKPVCMGPYVIGKTKMGKYVEWKRQKNWWGDNKKYLKNRFNFAKIRIRVIRDSKAAFEMFKKDKLTSYQVRTAAVWATETDFNNVKKGYVRKKRIFTQAPQGMYGLVMNLKFPLFGDRNVRRALSHLFDFETVNSKLMYNAYVRVGSAFEGTEYSNPKVKPYPFSPKNAARLLKKAGWSKRGADGVLTKGGKRFSFTLTYGSRGLEKHLTVYQEALRKQGIEMKMKLLDGATAFKYGMEKNFEMTILARTAGFYPSPEQYFHSDYANKKQNNNIMGFGRKDTDKLIDTYKKSLNFKKRRAAMYKLDQIIHDEAFYIPFWGAPFIRVMWWNRLGHTKNMETKLSDTFNSTGNWWYESVLNKSLKKAKKKKVSMKVDQTVDFDPYNLRK